MASLALGWIAEPTLAHLFDPMFEPLLGDRTAKLLDGHAVGVQPVEQCEPRGPLGTGQTLEQLAEAVLLEVGDHLAGRGLTGETPLEPEQHPQVARQQQVLELAAH